MIKCCLSGMLLALFYCVVSAGMEGTHEERESELSLNELFNLTIESSSFFERVQNLSPGYTTIIGDDKLGLSSVRTLRDIMNTMVIGMRPYTDASNGTVMGARGLTPTFNTKQIVLMDGHNLNQRKSWGAHSALLNSPLMLGPVQRAEITVGTGSLVFGSGALSGVVNLVPRNGRENPGFSTSAEYGTTETGVQADVQYGRSWGETRDLYLYGAIGWSKGFNFDPGYYEVARDTAGRPMSYTIDTAGGVKDTIDSLRLVRSTADLLASLGPDTRRVNSTAGLPRFNFFLNSNIERFKLQGGFFQDFQPEPIWWFAWTAGGWPYGSSPRSQAVTRIETMLYASPEYVAEINDYSTLSIGIDAHLNDMVWYHRLIPEAQRTPADTNRSYGPDEGVASENLSMLKLNFRNEYFDWLKVSLGGEAGYRKFNGGHSYFHGTAQDLSVGVEGGADFSWTEGAMFAEVIAITGNLTTDLGVRYDLVRFGKLRLGYNKSWYTYPDPYESHVSPRVALSYQVTDNDIIKGSYSEGFRFPDMEYLADAWKQTAFLATDTSILFDPAKYSFQDAIRKQWNAHHNDTMPACRPEQMQSVELNYVRTFAFPARVTVNGYINRLVNIISWDGSWGANFNNKFPFMAAGFEVIGEYFEKENWNLSVSYGYSRPLSVGFLKRYLGDGIADLTGVSDSAYMNYVTGSDTLTKSAWLNYGTHQLKIGFISHWLNRTLDVAPDMVVYDGIPADYRLGGTSNVSSDQNPLTKPQVYFDLGIRYTFPAHGWIQIKVENLFRAYQVGQGAMAAGWREVFYYVKAGISL